MKLFSKRYSGSKPIICSPNYLLTNFKNFNVYEENNNNEDPNEPQESASRVKQPGEEYSLHIMKLYPLGFNKTDKECENDEENAESDGQKSTGCSKPPRKKKKKKKNEYQDETEDEMEDEPHNCIYNVWVPDCMRSKKDFIVCQQINLRDLETKDMFEKVFQDNGYFNSVLDYEDFLECDKGTCSRILQGVETKYGVEIDVSDSFYGLTGSKLRAYSFQGANRKAVYIAFSYFSSSWTQDMAINTITNYDILFQPDDWYYSVIQIDKNSFQREQLEDDAKNKNEDIVNVSNKYDILDLNKLKINEVYEKNVNQNRLDTNSEVDSIEINNDNHNPKINISRKNDHLFKLCVKYLKAPKIKLQKLLFTSIKNETESISYTISNMAKLVNENNNQRKDSNSMSSENEGANHRSTNFLLDSYNKPIPIWIKHQLTDQSLKIY